MNQALGITSLFRWSAVVLLLMASSVDAQPVVGPLTSNRPGISDSESLVSRGVFQIEAGAQVQQEAADEGGKWTQTWGQLTLRYGLLDRFEVFAGWDGVSLERVSDDNAAGFVAGGNDLRIGTKIGVLNEERHRLTLALAPTWSVPVGSAQFSTGSNDGVVRVLWGRSLPQDWSLSGNLVFTRTTESGERYWENALIVGIGRSITDATSVFGELSAVLLADRSDAYTVDGGIAWVTRPDVQWDVSAGQTFAHSEAAWFVSAGISLRRRPSRLR